MCMWDVCRGSFTDLTIYILTVCPVIEYCGLAVQVIPFFTIFLFFVMSCCAYKQEFVLCYILPFTIKGGSMVLVYKYIQGPVIISCPSCWGPIIVFSLSGYIHT